MKMNKPFNAYHFRTHMLDLSAPEFRVRTAGLGDYGMWRAEAYYQAVEIKLNLQPGQWNNVVHSVNTQVLANRALSALQHWEHGQSGYV